MQREDVKKIMKSYWLNHSEAEEAINFVYDLLMLKVMGIKETGLDAIRAIRELEDAAYEVSRLTNDIDDTLKDE